jgi:FemAB-related protein (PEP-CTERM system-associated)
MQFKFLNNQNKDAYADFIKNHSSATIFHTLEWQKALLNSFNVNNYYGLIKNKGDNKVIGVVPLLLTQKLNFKKYLISLPFSSYGGFLHDDNVKENQILNVLKSFPYPLELKFFNPKLDIKNSSTLTFIIDLSEGTNKIWNSQKSKTRQNIRKAEKSGITFHTNGDFLDAFMKIYAINMKRLGTPQHSKKFFNNISKYLGNNCKVWVIKMHEKTVGASLMIFYRDTAYNLLTMTLPQYSKMKINNYLIWKTIENSEKLGYKTYDLGRSTKNTGAYYYKLRWNASPVALDYKIIYNNKTERIEVPQSGILSTIWSKLPLPMTKTLGPTIRRYVP